mmetsp:Transcript_47083/g.82045  ORF Transcript_47083/g.82045 Transcript_47083/m.82045 type:complete len:99 (-) Transcript_47083:54-350(-)
MLAKPMEVKTDQFLCEGVIWTRWMHCGDLHSVTHSSFLALDAIAFLQIVEMQPMVRTLARHHARFFVRALNFAEMSISDFVHSSQILQDALGDEMMNV